jgi:BlaI family penicillinase repressor
VHANFLAGMSDSAELSRRERQIMDILHAKGEAIAREVRQAMTDAPSYSAVRAMLRILEEKGHARHREAANRYVYSPRVSRQKASRSALGRVVTTFFGGSRAQAIAALLDEADAELTAEELKKIQKIINQAKKEGR